MQLELQLSSSPSKFSIYSASQKPGSSKFSFKVPILPLHSSSLTLPPCASKDDSSSILEQKPHSSGFGAESSSQPELPTVRRPVKEYSGDDADDLNEDRFSSSPIDAGLAEFAKKLPMFEPQRVDLSSEERPLLVNLDLALYRAKVLARKYQFEEAENILQKVLVLHLPFFLCHSVKLMILGLFFFTIALLVYILLARRWTAVCGFREDPEQTVENFGS